MGQSHGKADSTVTAHIKYADVVKKDDASGGLRLRRWTQDTAHPNVAAAGLVDDRRAKSIKLVAEYLAPLGQAARTEVWSATDDDTGGLSPGMGIDHLNSVERILHGLQGSFTWLSLVALKQEPCQAPDYATIA